MSEILQALEMAIEGGFALRVVYHGGSQPGRARDISPIAINGDQVRARCLATGQVKHFLVDRMRLADGGGADYVPMAKQAEAFASVAEVHAFTRDTLEGMGLDVQLREDGDDQVLRVCRLRKNGQPLKGAEVELHHAPMIRDYYMDLDDDGELVEMFSTRPAERPYLVRAKAGYSARFISLDRAVKKFLALVDKATS